MSLLWERIVWFILQQNIITILWSHLTLRWWNITLCLDELVMEINIMITPTRGLKVHGDYSLHPLAISFHRSLARYLSFTNTSHPSSIYGGGLKPAARFWLCKLLRFKSSQVSIGENHKNTWGISKSTFRKKHCRIFQDEWHIFTVQISLQNVQNSDVKYYQLFFWRVSVVRDSKELWSVIRAKIKIQIMLWCLAFYSASLLNYVPMFHRIMFGSFQLCSEV